MELTKNSLPFISGMGYRYQCDYVYDEFYKWDFDNQFDGMKIFVKTDYLIEFYSSISKISKKFFLYTHNSDINIDSSYRYILENDKIIKWYSVNVLLTDDRIESIPIGIANSRWEHGNIDIIKKIMYENNNKVSDYFCSFDVKTNSYERYDCLKKTKMTNNFPLNYEEYLRLLSQSKYSICPNGNGVDTHRVWESIYLNTIPIVIKNEHFINLSKIYNIKIINDWDVFLK